MPTYETLFITPPNLAEEDERATVEGLARVVTDGGGSLVANERMGRRRLAYAIRKFDDGVYTRFLYDSQADVAKELERRIRLSDKVLRSLTVRLEENWAASAKEQALRDAERRAQAAAEAERRAAEEAAARPAEDDASSSAPPAVAETAPASADAGPGSDDSDADGAEKRPEADA